MFYLPTS